jgi:gamma-polyglutamate synthase
VGDSIDFSSWVAGWSALAFVVAYGVYLITRARRHERAVAALSQRVLVTGSRGKSGTVRLIHHIVRASGSATYAKVTGTTAVEILPEGTEVPTKRWAAASVNEMPDAVIRAQSLGAEVGVFECMAVTPELIRLVHTSHVRSDIVVIPSIRLDHLEEEGLSEQEIATSIVQSLPGCTQLVVGIDQPEVLRVVQEFCDAHDITLTIAQPIPDQPHVAGHHPTNVAVALQVARLLGIDQNIARDSISTASVEPRALTMLVLEVTDGPELGLIDLGGANDPQSAYEALRALGLNEEGVIPLLVNRWERPLRSLVFMAAVLGRFETVGVVGPLGVWTTSFHRRSPQNSHQAHHQSTVVKITRAMARKPRLLAQRLLAESDIEPGSKVTLVLMENTHDSTADQLRTTFARQGREISLSDWLVPV